MTLRLVFDWFFGRQSVMGEKLAAGNTAIALLANTLATGAVLVALILTFGPISGAHFNPAVTLADASQRGIPWRECPGYITAQVVGAFAGVGAANFMFQKPIFFASQHVRNGNAQLFSEFVATFGLLCVIWGCVRMRSSAVPFAVGAYITAAYWFTASTSFANPAVTIARIETSHAGDQNPKWNSDQKPFFFRPIMLILARFQLMSGAPEEQVRGAFWRSKSLLLGYDGAEGL